MTSKSQALQSEPLRTLFLWRLLAAGGEDWQKAIKPKINATTRKELERIQLIETKKVKSSIYITLTDKGWSWAADHLDAEVSKTSNAAGPVLQLFLTRLKTFLAGNKTALGDFISQTRPGSNGPLSSGGTNGHTAPSFENRVRETYCRLAHDRWSTEVRLSDLRRQFCDMSRDEFDERLRRMESTNEIVLYKLDDPRQIGPEDEAGALHNSLGNPRHVVVISH